MSMYLLYGAIILVIIVLIFGTLTRRKIYREVDRLEDWKIEIMNRPITDEIGKVKGLKMSGETEEKFEVWRNNWDEIVDTRLPDIEEALFDIEEAANRYRFNKARLLVANTDKELNDIENKLGQMISDINGLIESEKQNRLEIGDVRSLYTEVKKHFHVHRSSFGKAALKVESIIEDLVKNFSTFEEATSEGNYINAREILLETKEKLDECKIMMDEIPMVLVQVTSQIPSDLDNLLSGIKEMEEAGFVLEDFSFDSRIERIEKECEEVLVEIENLELHGISELIEKINDEIEEMYDELEREVIAKNNVENAIGRLHIILEESANKLTALEQEIGIVQQSYRITEEQISFHKQLEKQLAVFTKRVSVIVDVVTTQKQSFLSIEATINQLYTDFEEFISSIDTFNDTIQTLREDEMKAKETLKELKSKLLEGKRNVQKSNIPGLPQRIIDEMKIGEKKLTEAMNKLEEIPLEMSSVNDKVSEAVHHINNSVLLLNETIEKAEIAERIIQYGNRYRTNSPRVNELLKEAEQCFRNYYYEDAIELAATSIEKYEPTIREKIRDLVEERV